MPEGEPESALTKEQRQLGGTVCPFGLFKRVCLHNLQVVFLLECEVKVAKVA